MITNYEDLTLEKYYQIINILKNYENTENGVGLQDQIQILSILSGKTTDEIKRMPFSEVSEMSKAASFIYDETPTITPITYFEHNKIKYYLTSLTEGSFNAYATYMYIGELYDIHNIKRLTNRIAIACREKDELFDTEFEKKLPERAKIFEQLPVPVGLGLAAFFLSKKEMCEKVSQLCSVVNQRISQLSKNVQTKFFMISTDGSVLPTRSLIAFMVIMKSYKWLRTKYSYILQLLRITPKEKNKSK